jgi:hypothetical protein
MLKVLQGPQICFAVHRNLLENTDKVIFQTVQYWRVFCSDLEKFQTSIISPTCFHLNRNIL